MTVCATNNLQIGNLKILYLNICSLRNKIFELETLINEYKTIDIVILTEVWVYSNEIMTYNIPNYNAVFNCRDEKRGGGTVIFIKNNINFTEVIKDEKYNFNVIEILNCQPNLRIGVFYKAPLENSNIFIDYLENKLRNKGNYIFFADTNLNLFDNSNVVIKYKDMIVTSGYSIVNKTESTRNTIHSNTLIDHIITNLADKYNITFSIENNNLSDHQLAIVSLKAVNFMKIPMKKHTKSKTDYNQMYNIVNNKIENTDILEIDTLIKIIQEAKVLCTTSVTVRTRNNSWITPLIYEKLKIRKLLYDSHKKDPENNDKRIKYNQFKKKVEKLIKEGKKNHINRSIENAGSNSRKLWKVINNTISNTNKEISEYITSVVKLNGEKTNNENETANTFNAYFNDVGESIIKGIKKNNVVNNSVQQIRNCKTLVLFPVTETEIYKIIMELNRNSAPGLDKITVKDLQELVNIIKQPLANLINKCFMEGIFPDSLKKAYIVPIHKSGSKNECGNYRPISILNSISKIFEKAINIRIKNFISKTIGFDQNQYGFLENSGTESAITATLEQIYDALDEGHFVGAVFIDLTKAFDVVNHSRLVNFLDKLGIRGNCNLLLKSYLTNRTQCVKVNEFLSDELIIKTGVPQGSLLGPLLYLLYIMNIPKNNIISKYNVYADDTNIIAKAKSVKDLENILNQDLNTICNWLDCNELCINAKKTNYLLFKTQKKNYENFTLKIRDTTIERVDNVKYLGITIDENLKWDNHIKNMKKKVMPIILAIKRAGGIPNHAAKLVYNSHILSRIRYNICSWSHCSNFHINQIGILMNKALKILFNYNPRTSTKYLYKTINELDINQLIYYEKCKYIYKILNTNLKSNLILKNRENFHKYNTRNKKNIEIPKARTTMKQKSLKCSAIKMFNSLPIEIRNSQTLAKFNRKLKEHVKNFRN